MEILEKMEKKKIREYIKLDEWKKELIQQHFDQIYIELLKRTYDFITDLVQEKKIPLKIDRTDFSTDQIYHVKRILEEKTISFESLITLLEAFLNWNVDPLDSFDTKEERLKRMIRLYNSSIREFESYENSKKELEGKSFEIELEKRTKKLIQTFQEMMNYKTKPYQQDWDFAHWIHEIDLHYHFYHELLKDALSLVYEGGINVEIIDYGYDTIDADEIEILQYLDDLYSILNGKEENYKEHANDYLDVDLKPGQTYSDVFDEKEEQLVQLLKKMLDEIHVPYQREDFPYLSTLVCEHYPYYAQNLMSLRGSMANPNNTMIAMVDRLEMVYQFFLKDYKNREENMKKYLQDHPIEEPEFREN